MNNSTLEQFEEIVKRIKEKRSSHIYSPIDTIKPFLLDNGHLNIKMILSMPQRQFEEFIIWNDGISYVELCGRNFEEDHENIKLMKSLADDLFEINFKDIPIPQRKTALKIMIINLCNTLLMYKFQILYYKYHQVEYYTDELLFTFMRWIHKIIPGILFTDFSLEERKQLWNKINTIFTK